MVGVESLFIMGPEIVRVQGTGRVEGDMEGLMGTDRRIQHHLHHSRGILLFQEARDSDWVLRRRLRPPRIFLGMGIRADITSPEINGNLQITVVIIMAAVVRPQIGTEDNTKIGVTTGS